MKIIDGAKFPAPLEMWGFSPRQIESEGRAKLSESSRIMQLRYAAMELLSSAFLVWEDCKLSRDEIEDHAFIQGDALYLNDTEGYRLDEHLSLSYLYINTDGRMCAAVCDEAADDFTYWCIY